MWTAWGKWGKCDKDCGDEGSRKRTRWIILEILPVAQIQMSSDNKSFPTFRKCVGACDETANGGCIWVLLARHTSSLVAAG